MSHKTVFFSLSTTQKSSSRLRSVIRVKTDFNIHCYTHLRCAEGCRVTVAVSNDGRTYSGRGANGESWTGSTSEFSLKEVVPTVHYITTDLPGYRDSTRIFGGINGGTTITVHGNNFQDSHLLRCFFATFTMAVQAEYISSSQVRCVTPPFRSVIAEGQITGTGESVSCKVQVSNDGGVTLSQNPFLADDGSYMYTRTFDHNNTWEADGISGYPFRSTCREGEHPNEMDKPCRGAHMSGTNYSPAFNMVMIIFCQVILMGTMSCSSILYVMMETWHHNS